MNQFTRYIDIFKKNPFFEGVADLDAEDGSDRTINFACFLKPEFTKDGSIQGF